MIHIAVCDDEFLFQNELAQKIHKFFQDENIDSNLVQFSDGQSLLEYSKPLDIIFLDIKMDRLSGMDTAKKLRSQNFHGYLIFVTALPELVFDAFEVQAYDYLVKPLEKRRFQRTMRRLVTAVRSNGSSHLLIQKAGESRLLSLNDLVYCEVINRKIYLHLNNREVVDYYNKLEDLEEELDRRFFKCHRSYLINLNYLTGYTDKLARMSTGEVLPVSRLRKQALSEAVLQFFKEGR